VIFPKRQDGPTARHLRFVRVAARLLLGRRSRERSVHHVHDALRPHIVTRRFQVQHIVHEMDFIGLDIRVFPFIVGFFLSLVGSQ
jgi:hypothetical protein